MPTLTMRRAAEWVSYKTVYVGASEARVLPSQINLVVLAVNNVTVDLLPEQLSPSVTARVPALISRTNLYFQYIYQAIIVTGYGVNLVSHE
jgi:UDP-galactopyranose mutase